MSTISERIKQIRRTVAEKKMSQEEFAASLGVSSSVVANWEDAERRLKNGIPDYQLRHICDVYHIQYRWLVSGEGEMMEEIDPDDLVEKHMADQSDFVKSIMKAFAKLPDEDWIKLRDMVDKIKKGEV